jgi:hypothetical protein
MEPLIEKNKASIDGRFQAAAAMMDFAQLHLKNKDMAEAKQELAKAKQVLAQLGTEPEKLSDTGKKWLADMTRSISALENEAVAVPVSDP